MHKKVLFFSAALLFPLFGPEGAKAQENRGDASKEEAPNEPKFVEKLTWLAGGGVSVVNSDNWAKLYQGEVGFLRGNGYGPNLTVGALYPLSGYVGVLGSVEYLDLEGKEDTGENAIVNSSTFRSRIFAATATAIVSIASRRALSRFNAATAPEKVLVLPYVRTGLGLLQYRASSRSRYVPAGDRAGMAAVIPISQGARFKYSSRISFAPEITLNVNTTDYLDNMGRSGGYTGDKDNIFSASVKVMYTPFPGGQKR